MYILLEPLIILLLLLLLQSKTENNFREHMKLYGSLKCHKVAKKTRRANCKSILLETPGATSKSILLETSEDAYEEI